MALALLANVGLPDAVSLSGQIIAQVPNAFETKPGFEHEALLASADLSYANLFGANLQDSDLRNVNLFHATLLYARLERAKLDSARITDANLGEAQLEAAQLPAAFLGDSDLTAANFRGANLRGADLGRIEGEDVILAGADLRDSNLEKADLYMANLRGANLRGSNLRDANLNQAHMEGADLSDVDLIRARMTGVNLCGANLRRAKIYGLARGMSEPTSRRSSANSASRRQDTLTASWSMTRSGAVYQCSDRSREAQKVITAVANRAVLILGRFSETPRKAFLEALANALRDRGLLPIIYDFERPPEQDWTETVLTLANLSLFVIADITKASSVPLELQASVPICMVPFVPVHKKGEPAFSMFKNLQKKYDWVLPVIRYSREESIVAAFDDAILTPALEMRRRLKQRKAEG